jgi:hypothetical protein
VESVDRDLMDSITMSYTSEVQYAKTIDVQRQQRRRDTQPSPATVEQVGSA